MALNSNMWFFSKSASAMPRSFSSNHSRPKSALRYCGGELRAHCALARARVRARARSHGLFDQFVSPLVKQYESGAAGARVQCATRPFAVSMMSGSQKM